MKTLISATPRTVLILGAGYLGGALADYLTECGHHAITADCNGHAMYTVDVRDGDSLLELARCIPSPDAVVLCVSTRGGSVEEYLHLYVEGAALVAECFKGSRLILCSSTAVYGVTDGAWVTEEHNVYPASPRKAALLQAEQTILAAGGLVLRLAAIYGPKRCELAARYCHMGKALSGKLNRWVNYIHRDDAVTALYRLCILNAPPPGIYNATDCTPMQLSEIYSYLSGLLGIPQPVEVPLAPGARRGFTNQRISCSRLLSLGWEPLYPSFLDGVHHVLEELN